MKKHEELFRFNMNRAEQARNTLKARADFQMAVLNVRSKWHIVPGDLERDANLNKLPKTQGITLGGGILYSHRTIKKGGLMYKDIIKILKQFRKSEESWFGAVSHYVLYDEFNPWFKSTVEAETEPDIIIGNDSVSGRTTYSIKLRENTTLDDVIDVWSGIIELRELDNEENGIVKKKFSRRKNFDRGYDILNLYKNDYANDEIIRIINQKYNQFLDPGNIKKIVSVMGKEFGVKGKKLRTSKIARERLA